MSGSPRGPARQEIVIIDAGPAVGFAATARLPLLIGVFGRVRIRCAVPFVVDKEVRGKDRQYPGVSKRWAAAVTAGHIEVFNEVAVGVGDQRVVAEVARLRDADPYIAMSSQRDLGEVLTVAHAVVARRDGSLVRVGIDDTYGAGLAAGERLQNIDTVAILRLAIRLNLVTTKAELRTLYRALSKCSRLPPLASTGLLDEFTV